MTQKEKVLLVPFLLLTVLNSKEKVILNFVVTLRTIYNYIYLC